MMNDIFMTRWDEPHFAENHERAAAVVGTQVRCVSNISGIHDAHLACANMSSTAFFWCIDGDNWLTDNAREDLAMVEGDAKDDSVYVMRAVNPFNGLVYGHGAIKLFPTRTFINNLNRSAVDMTSGAKLSYRIVHRMTSEHRYHGSAFHAWRTAFRECVKLASSIIPNTKQDETAHRLDVWCDASKITKMDFWEENMSGALCGRDYGTKHKDDKKALAMINDFSWLRQEFDNHE